MNKYFIFIFILSMYFNYPSYSAILYVDSGTPEPGSSWDGVDGHPYTGSPGFGVGYSTIQAAFSTMSTGDTIFLRNGTYTENFGNSFTAIECPSSINGDSWEDGHYNTVSSYPNEWAVLDGINNSKYVVFGKADNGHGTTDVDLRYWKFERLEVTGGDKGGFGIWRGPVIVQYCYIHDNYDGTYNENPSGFRSYHLQNSVISYNWFADNGGNSGHNQAHIQIFNDYEDCFNGVDLSGRRVVKGNEISYNYFEGNTFVGIKHKGNGQCLTDESNPDTSNKSLGSKWHHNIISGTTIAIHPRQDYIQIYNNICDSGLLLLNAASGSGSKQKFYQVCYNNTIINNAIWCSLGYSTDYCGITYPLTLYHPRLYIYNNIVTEFTSTWDHASITAGSRMASGNNTFITTDLSINNNFIWKPNDTDHFLMGRGLVGSCDYDEGGCTSSDFDALYGFTNYTNSTNGLFQGTIGADKYITNGYFIVSSSTTIANGGRGGIHPYLNAANIPAYIGATEPNNISWVENVINLINLPSGYIPYSDVPSKPNGVKVENIKNKKME